MDIVVSGSTGLIGSTLVPALRGAGHTVRRLVRRPPAADDEIAWDPAAGTIDAAGLAGVDAAVHLAGEGIGERRWTDAQKRRIRDSRTSGTTLLASTLAALDPRPAVLLSGSAVGFYGDAGDEPLTEASPGGTGFLADVVAEWEASTATAEDAGIRTVHLRTGLVLSRRGGAMGRLLPLFRAGLGGPIGRGQEWWPWIALDDHVAATMHLLDADLRGPVNLVAPSPVRNRDFARTLGHALHRPAFLPVPRLGPRLLLGRELADALLGQSQRVVPTRLVESGFTFGYPEVEAALEALVARD